MKKLESINRNSSKKGTISVSKSPLLFSLFANPVCGVGLKIVPVALGLLTKEAISQGLHRNYLYIS